MRSLTYYSRRNYTLHQHLHQPQLFIYALKLVQDKYYIGSTIDPPARLDQHIARKASAWTTKYRVTDIVEFFEGDHYDEDLVTKKYMYEYGIDNVRGASYTQLVLDAGSRTSLIRELRAANGLCIRCGRKGHFIAACYAATSGDSYPLGVNTTYVNTTYVNTTYVNTYADLNKLDKLPMPSVGSNVKPVVKMTPLIVQPTQHSPTPIQPPTFIPPQFHMIDESIDVITEPGNFDITLIPQIPPHGIIADIRELAEATNLLAVKIIEWFI